MSAKKLQRCLLGTERADIQAGRIPEGWTEVLLCEWCRVMPAKPGFYKRRSGKAMESCPWCQTTDAARWAVKYEMATCKTYDPPKDAELEAWYIQQLHELFPGQYDIYGRRKNQDMVSDDEFWKILEETLEINNY